MTIDEVVWLICMFKKVKPARILWENIREAGEDRAEAEGVEEVVCVTLQERRDATEDRVLDALAAAARPRLALSVSSKGCFGCRRGTGRAQRVVLKNTSGWIRTCPRASSQGRTSLPTGQGRGHFRAGQSFVSVKSQRESAVTLARSVRADRTRAGSTSERARRVDVGTSMWKSCSRNPKSSQYSVGTPVLA